MNTVLPVIIILLSFVLGSLPFSVWVGRIALQTDIRQYGDGNPGSMNVFRTGHVIWGVVAVVADILKGMPAILLGKIVFALPQPVLYIAALAAVTGHAYSPFLGFKGGKALAVFGGTIIALSQWDMMVIIAGLLLIGALFFINDAWAVLVSMAGALIYLLIVKSDIWIFTFIGGVAIIFVLKQRRFLKEAQYPHGRLVAWLRSRKRTT